MGNCLKSPTSDDISLLHESQSDRASYGDGAEPDQEPPPPYQDPAPALTNNDFSRRSSGMNTAKARGLEAVSVFSTPLAETRQKCADVIFKQLDFPEKQNISSLLNETKQKQRSGTKGHLIAKLLCCTRCLLEKSPFGDQR
ncbi:hypothetical protein DV515_00004749, partial [Chloebia gouldiae]